MHGYYQNLKKIGMETKTKENALGLEIDGMPHVLHAGKNIAHRRTPPAVGVFKLAVSTVTHAFAAR